MNIFLWKMFNRTRREKVKGKKIFMWHVAAVVRSQGFMTFERTTEKRTKNTMPLALKQ